MHSLTQWEQSSTFDPYNPNQISREPNNTYPGQGGYSTFYWNKRLTTVGQVLGGLGDIPAWGSTLLVGGIAAVVGYFGLKFAGPKLGLSGPRGRRRRRR